MSEHQLIHHLDHPSLRRIRRASSEPDIDVRVSEFAIPGYIEDPALLVTGESIAQRSSVHVVLDPKIVPGESAVRNLRRGLVIHGARSARYGLIEPRIRDKMPAVKSISKDRDHLPVPEAWLSQTFHFCKLEVQSPIETFDRVVRSNVLQLRSIALQATCVLPKRGGKLQTKFPVVPYAVGVFRHYLERCTPVGWSLSRPTRLVDVSF